MVLRAIQALIYLLSIIGIVACSEGNNSVPTATLVEYLFGSSNTHLNTTLNVDVTTMHNMLRATLMDLTQYEECKQKGEHYLLLRFQLRETGDTQHYGLCLPQRPDLRLFYSHRHDIATSLQRLFNVYVMEDSMEARDVVEENAMRINQLWVPALSVAMVVLSLLVVLNYWAGHNSLKSAVLSIFQSRPNEEDFLIFNAIRIWCTYWLISYELFMRQKDLEYNTKVDMCNNNQYIVNKMGGFGDDVLFMLAGFFTSFCFARKANGRGHWNLLPSALLTEYLRLVPMVALSLFFAIYIFPLLHDSPLVYLSFEQSDRCRTHWPHVLLGLEYYIWTPVKCIPWAWFVHALLLFSLVAMIVHHIALKNGKAAAFGLVTMVVGSFVYHVAYNEKFFIVWASKVNFISFAPYAGGIALYYAWQLLGPSLRRKHVLWCFWASLAILGGSVCWSWTFPFCVKEDYARIVRPWKRLEIVLVRNSIWGGLALLAFSLSVPTPAFDLKPFCNNPLFLYLSKASYGANMVSPVLVQMFYTLYPRLGIQNDPWLIMLYLNAGVFALSYCIGLLLLIFIDAPSKSLVKALEAKLFVPKPTVLPTLCCFCLRRRVRVRVRVRLSFGFGFRRSIY